MKANRNISYMSDEEIINFIKDYIEKSSYNYAILINGRWGSGKTYFVKNVLFNALTEEREDESNNKKECKDKRIIYRIRSLIMKGTDRFKEEKNIRIKS